MIKYLGSKKRLLPDIGKLSRAFCPNPGTFLDTFSGTCRVGHYFKEKGHTVYANDLGNYAYVIAQCLIEGDVEKHTRDANSLIRELNDLPGKEGWFTQTYCKDSKYFKPKNGRKVDAIREEIEKKNLPPVLKSILLTSLMLAADAVDSTCGVQMAYLKGWATRADNDLTMKLPLLVEGPVGKAYLGDAVDIGKKVGKVQIAYLDPPYNQHSYLGNYHIWESLVLWDKPEVYGIAKKREDCRTRKSDFNKKGEILRALRETISGIVADLYIVSFNNEGYISVGDMTDMLNQLGVGYVRCKSVNYKRYVGAQIGIYNPLGEKVGKVTHTTNKELLFTVSKLTPTIEAEYIVEA